MAGKNSDSEKLLRKFLLETHKIIQNSNRQNSEAKKAK